MNKKIPTLLAILIILLVMAVIAGISLWLCSKEKTENVVCTQEAKLCLDGSYVGRTGPNCEFAPCPATNTDETADWKIYRNEEYDYEMKYPKDWVAERSSGYDDEFKLYYESNRFMSPDVSYVLFFGIVPKESNIVTPQLRTGVQAGDFVDSNEAVNIGGAKVYLKELVYEGKVKEIFFNHFEINDFKGGAEFSYFGGITHQGWEEYDMSGKPELDTAKKILSTFRFLK